MSNEAPIAYLYTGDDGSKELILDCNGEHARVLLDLGYTETPLFASRATDTALVEALEWYGEQARLARLIHSEGDAGRHALQDDGGKRARTALANTPKPNAAVVDALRDERGWLIEITFAEYIHWVALSDEKWPRTKITNSEVVRKYVSPLRFTKDANEALRFARKEDAAAFAELFSEFILGDYKPTEHIFATLANTPKQSAGLVEELREALIRADYEWHGPFGKEKHRIIPPALFDRILAVLEGKRT